MRRVAVSSLLLASLARVALAEAMPEPACVPILDAQMHGYILGRCLLVAAPEATDAGGYVLCGMPNATNGTQPGTDRPVVRRAPTGSESVKEVLLEGVVGLDLEGRCGWTTTNEVFCWNGAGATPTFVPATAITGLPDRRIRRVTSAVGAGGCAVFEDDDVWCWGAAPTSAPTALFGGPPVGFGPWESKTFPCTVSQVVDLTRASFVMKARDVLTRQVLEGWGTNVLNSFAATYVLGTNGQDLFRHTFVRIDNGTDCRTSFEPVAWKDVPGGVVDGFDDAYIDPSWTPQLIFRAGGALAETREERVVDTLDCPAFVPNVPPSCWRKHAHGGLDWGTKISGQPVPTPTFSVGGMASIRGLVAGSGDGLASLREGLVGLPTGVNSGSFAYRGAILGTLLPEYDGASIERIRVSSLQRHPPITHTNYGGTVTSTYASIIADVRAPSWPRAVPQLFGVALRDVDTPGSVAPVVLTQLDTSSRCLTGCTDRNAATADFEDLYSGECLSQESAQPSAERPASVVASLGASVPGVIRLVDARGAVRAECGNADCTVDLTDASFPLRVTFGHGACAERTGAAVFSGSCSGDASAECTIGPPERGQRISVRVAGAAE